MNEIFEDKLLPLYLVAKTQNECIYGKTRFQKLFFVLQKRMEESKKLDPIFEFTQYHYGPYSQDLAHEIESLVKQNLLEERIQITYSGYDFFTYCITKRGKLVIKGASEKQLISKSIIKMLQKVIDELGELDLETLVKRAYDYLE